MTPRPKSSRTRSPTLLAPRLDPGTWCGFRSAAGGFRASSCGSRRRARFPDARADLPRLGATRPPPAQLALAGWISEQTLAPLIESLRLMLPAGLSQRGRTVFVRTSTPAPGGLTEKQAALLDAHRPKAGRLERTHRGRQAGDPARRSRAADRDGPGDAGGGVPFPAAAAEDRSPGAAAGRAERALRRRLLDARPASKQADALAWLAAKGRRRVPLPDLLTGAGVRAEHGQGTGRARLGDPDVRRDGRPEPVDRAPQPGAGAP